MGFAALARPPAKTRPPSAAFVAGRRVLVRPLDGHRRRSAASAAWYSSVLTRQGWVVTVVSVALVVAGRLFGIFELFVLGAGGAALVIAAAVFVGLTRVHLDVTRELRPDRIHAGQPANVQLHIHNRGTRRAPVLALRDAVEGIDRTAGVVLAPLAAGQTVSATYSLPTDRRGVLGVGPMEVRIGDPFGLASVASPGAPMSRLVIWPAVDRVLPLPLSPGTDRDLEGEPSGRLAVQGEELYALRPYTDGDDRRHVHWRASARYDDLVVRQHERPSPGRGTVVLDTSARSYEGETFERAVSAAASIALAGARHRLQVRLITTAGYDSGFGSDPRHLDGIMEHLAVVAQRDLGHLPTLVGSLRRSGPGRGAPLAVLTGASADASGVTVMREPGALPATVVAFAAARLAGGATSPPPAGVIVVDPTISFAAAWNQALAAGSRRLAAPMAGR